MNGYDEPYKLGFASDALEKKTKNTILHIVRPKNITLSKTK